MLSFASVSLIFAFMCALIRLSISMSHSEVAFQLKAEIVSDLIYSLADRFLMQGSAKGRLLCYVLYTCALHQAVHVQDSIDFHSMRQYKAPGVPFVVKP